MQVAASVKAHNNSSGVSFSLSSHTTATRRDTNNDPLFFSSSTPLMGDHYVLFGHRDKRRIVVFVLLAFIVGATFYTSTHLPTFSITDAPTIANSQETVVPAGISYSTFQHGLAQCETLSRPRPVAQPVSERTMNPRGAVNTTLLVKNGYIWLGNQYMDGGDVLVQDGVIREIAMGIDPSRADKVIDAGGRVVTPGIIDMHSHMMVDSIGGISAAIDGHEMSGPTKPYVSSVYIVMDDDAYMCNTRYELLMQCVRLIWQSK